MIHLPRLAQVLLGRGTRPCSLRRDSLCALGLFAYSSVACVIASASFNAKSLQKDKCLPKPTRPTSFKASAPNPKPQTLNPKPLNPKPLNPNPLELTIKPKLTDCAHKGVLEESIGAGSLQCVVGTQQQG